MCSGTKNCDHWKFWTVTLLSLFTYRIRGKIAFVWEIICTSTFLQPVSLEKVGVPTFKSKVIEFQTSLVCKEYKRSNCAQIKGARANPPQDWERA